jgi:hypothetical protein
LRRVGWHQRHSGRDRRMSLVVCGRRRRELRVRLEVGRGGLGEGRTLL